MMLNYDDMLNEAYLNGIFPRSDAALEAGSAWLKGRISKEDFCKILEKETVEIINLQEELELDYITDGQLFWHDFLRPFASALGLHRKGSSADENPVTRQIYTNTFYRKPLIEKRITDFDKEIIDARFIETIPRGKRKIILPSPFAFVYLSDGIHKNENGELNISIFKEIILDISKVLNNEARRLEKKSDVSFVQFNDSCMAYAKETELLWETIIESLNVAAKDVHAITSLHLYNGDISLFLPKILDIPVQRIGIDPYAANLDKFKGIKFNKILELGAVNSKNSLVEEPQTIVQYAEEVINKINPKGIALVPNRPLELVPKGIAIKKLESLSKAARLLRGAA